MKERYNVAPWNDGKDAVCKAEDGKYILYTDHLAEIREIVDTYDLLIDQCDKKNSELEDERDGYRNGQQQVQDLLAKQIDNSLKLAAENRRLRELVDGATEVVEISNFTFPAQREWKAAWLKKAAKAMKQDDWLKECQENDRLQAALSAAQGEVERLRETLDDIAHVGNYEASQRAIDALKEAKGECHHLTAYYNEEADNYYCSECHRGMGIAYYNVAQALLKTERQKQEIQKSPQTP